MHYLNEGHILFFLLQVAILLGMARLLGEVFRRIGQPAITAEIIVGILMGPTIIGRFFPEFHGWLFPKEAVQTTMFETVAWLGILFFLLKTGIEIDFSSAWRQKGDALTIALSDVVLPVVIAFVPCYFLPAHFLVDPSQRVLFALFIATVMTISALPVTARILEDLRMYKTDVGFLVMSALAANDIIGWVAFTIILGLFTQSGVDVHSISIILGATILFVVFSLTIGRKLSNVTFSFLKKTNMPEPGIALTLVAVLGMLFGAITLKIGIHALFGFFIAGIIVGEAKDLSDKTRHVLSETVHAILVPLFFVGIGLKIDFFANFDILPVSVLSIIGILGRYVGAFAGVAMTKQAPSNRNIISIAHTPGGEMQIVVGILALEYKLISEPVFVAIVFSAVLSTIIIGPWMSWALRRRKRVEFLEFLGQRYLSVDNPELESQTDVIRFITQLTVENMQELPAEAVIQKVLEREQLTSTAIGMGGAVPHARLKAIDRPIISFALLKKPVAWNSRDDIPVSWVFLLLMPEKDDGMQLQILRTIALRMESTSARQRIAKCHDSDSLSKVIRDIFSHDTIAKTNLIRKTALGTK